MSIVGLATLKLVCVQEADDGCTHSEACERMAYVYTLPGFDGYVEACREHARDMLYDAIELNFDGNSWEVRNGKLVEVTTAAESR